MTKCRHITIWIQVVLFPDGTKPLAEPILWQSTNTGAFHRGHRVKEYKNRRLPTAQTSDFVCPECVCFLKFDTNVSGKVISVKTPYCFLRLPLPLPRRYDDVTRICYIGWCIRIPQSTFNRFGIEIFMHIKLWHMANHLFATQCPITLFWLISFLWQHGNPALWLAVSQLLQMSERPQYYTWSTMSNRYLISISRKRLKNKITATFPRGLWGKLADWPRFRRLVTVQPSYVVWLEWVLLRSILILKEKIYRQVSNIRRTPVGN